MQDPFRQRGLSPASGAERNKLYKKNSGTVEACEEVIAANIGPCQASALSNHAAQRATGCKRVRHRVQRRGARTIAARLTDSYTVYWYAELCSRHVKGVRGDRLKATANPLRPFLTFFDDDGEKASYGKAVARCQRAVDCDMK